MSVADCIGNFFLESWIYGKYEREIHSSILAQIDQQFPTQKNLLLNLTFWDEKTDKEVKQYIDSGANLDNLFVLSTVDSPTCAMPNQLLYNDPNIKLNMIINSFNAKNVYRMGNFSGQYEFNFFAIVCNDNFKSYDLDELLLVDPKYLFINYNRKPHPHRVEFVKQLLIHNLKDLGIVTLGRDQNSLLYFSIGESAENYVKYGHWYNLDQGPGSDQFGIPHDLFSLHNMYYWKHHFLHVVGSTEGNQINEPFVNQIEFKPIIGLRPFVINGQQKIYQWLRDNGFKTFNHYFPTVDLEGGTTAGEIYNAIIQVLTQLSTLSKEELVALYNQMLPDLLYNRQRFFEFAKEQEYKMKHLFQ